MTTARLTRRGFLFVAGSTASAAVVSACSATPAPAPAVVATEAATVPPPPTATPSAAVATAAPATEVPAGRYEEAPSLAELVTAGKLPPVDERLPLEPMVIECVEEPGQWSEDLHRANTTMTDIGDYNTQVREGLTRFDYRSGSLGVVANLAKSWDISDGGATFTFHLREGTCWSDGEPFTADDIMFWYEDIALNTELSPVFPNWLIVAGEPPVVEKVDDYTFTMKFAKPYGLLIEFLAFRGSEMLAPKHYLTQFHPKYADKADLDKMVADAKFDNWFQLFSQRNRPWLNPDIPVLYAWQVEVPPDTGRLVARRNPYYWKVDTNGKQLPYFERLICDLAQEQQAVLMKAIAGEVDYQYRHMGFSNYTLLKENEEKGGYTVREWGGGSFPCVYVNVSVKDPELRALFQAKDFRHALSYAMHREEMSDLFWHGMGEPMNPAGRPGDPYWQEGFGKVAVDYDPDQANALLDGLGLTERDGDGYRLRPDGQRLMFTLECYPAELGAPAIDIFEQVATYWRAVGVDAQAKEIERSLWSQRALGNEIDMPSYGIDEIQWRLTPQVYVPYGTSYWAPGFAPWATSGGKSGEEPPDEVKDLINWYEELKVEPDAEKRIALGRQILGRHNEMLYMIGTVFVNIVPMIVKNDLVNVLEKAVGDWCTLHESISWPFQFWRRQS